MNVFKTQKTLLDYIQRQKEMGKKMGFAPTMGALHEGHLSLYKMARAQNDTVVSSIFINPTQFNNAEDFKKYPKTLETDLKMLEKAGVDAVYIPEVADIYPEKLDRKKYDFDGLEKEMEGHYRPGHFDGVGTVVEILFRQVQPHNAYFGEKDYQQLAIIEKLVFKKGLPITICRVPTLREEDGLAMSSRNVRLSEKQRKEAPLLYQTLLMAKQEFGKHPLQEIYQRVKDGFEASPFRLEYFIIADENTLKETHTLEDQKKYRAFIAAYAGEVRLIDNLGLN